MFTTKLVLTNSRAFSSPLAHSFILPQMGMVGVEAVKQTNQSCLFQIIFLMKARFWNFQKSVIFRFFQIRPMKIGQNLKQIGSSSHQLSSGRAWPMTCDSTWWEQFGPCEVHPHKNKPKFLHGTSHKTDRSALALAPEPGRARSHGRWGWWSTEPWRGMRAPRQTVPCRRTA